ncbi:MAG: cytochrome c [Ignavibacteriales bacterium]|nr:MAG: cytochrome c [Ignavibacteriales bacterium]
MKNLMMYLLFVVSIVLLFGFAYSYAQNTEPEGQKIFVEKKCGSCHSVNSVELTSKKKDAVDLSVTGSNRTADFLTKYLKKAEKLDGKDHKTAFKGTDEELKALVSWLVSLKK